MTQRSRSGLVTNLITPQLGDWGTVPKRGPAVPLLPPPGVALRGLIHRVRVTLVRCGFVPHN